MNWHSRRLLLVPLRWPNIPPRGVWTLGFAAICLAWVGLRVAVARQTGQAVPTQETPREQYLNARPGVEYLGDEVCRACHPSEYGSFKQTGMGRSVSLPST